MILTLLVSIFLSSQVKMSTRVFSELMPNQDILSMDSSDIQFVICFHEKRRIIEDEANFPVKSLLFKKSDNNRREKVGKVPF